ncbi:MAG TPA: FKBP-type peptidyl-prolyl cis-trans isomerase [Solirubrobacterales bacterium]|nr:FKBP-type peptidyl-prolyl cis-trans isomerase [Solirubrobacterales bacterium]
MACLCLGLALTSCGGGDDPSATQPDDSATADAGESSTGTTESSSTSASAKPELTVPTNVPENQLVFRDVKEGSGPAAKAGDQLGVQYVGIGYKTGEEFDSSWDESEPFTFTLGQGEVIDGWDRGLVGMKVGGRRELVIPAKLAYGSEGTSSIAPDEALVFAVELLAIE